MAPTATTFDRRRKPKRDFLAPRPRKDKKRKATEEEAEPVEATVEAAGAAGAGDRPVVSGRKERADVKAKEKEEKEIDAGEGERKERKKKRRKTGDGAVGAVLAVAAAAADSLGESEAADFGLGAAREQQEKQEKVTRRERTQAAQAAAAEKRKNRKPKYIVFVGNLPFSADEIAIRKQFRACRNFGDIVGVRLLTKKGTEEPKGCAFVEFSEGACVAQALKLHHSLMEGRKINVEKTVGGGGNGPNRRAKLTEKLDRLTRERQRHFNTVVREQAQQGYEYN